MRSSSGSHFDGLDHLRALAAFLVVLWHFIDPFQNHPSRWNPAPELGLIAEGHSGVALFMTLSGYLFAKLIGDREVHYLTFLWNRAVRLVPLFVTVLVLGAIVRLPDDQSIYLKDILTGFLLPTMPQGGWSIVVEVHFYILLPVLLLLSKRAGAFPIVIVCAAIALRICLYEAGYDIKETAYYTLVGRIDQFALGILFYRYPPSGRMTTAAIGLLWIFYAWFESAGGYHQNDVTSLWIILPTIEAVGFASLVSWYDRHPLTGKWIWPLRKAGDYSYAIYLLHFFLINGVSAYVNDHIVPLTSIYVALPFAFLFFGYMTLLGWASHRLIEGHFMRFRRPYFVERLHPCSVQPQLGTMADNPVRT